MEYYRFLFYFELINGFVLIAALLFRRHNRLPNFFLAAFLLVALYCQWIRFLTISGEIRDFPYLLGTWLSGILLAPSIFYLYVLCLTIPDFRWRSSYFLHFLPSVGGLLFYFIVRALTEKEAFWGGPNPFPVQRYIFTIIAVLVWGGYLVACFRELHWYRIEVIHYFSEIRHVRLLWLRNLLFLLIIPWLVGLVEIITGPFLTVEKWMIPSSALVILLMGFFGLRQSIIFSSGEDWGETYPQKILHSKEANSKDPRIGVFTLEELSLGKKRLEQFFVEQKPYLYPELRLVDLAKELRLKPHQVSEILNRGMGTTFYDFVNRHRIDEAMRRLKDPQYSQFNILGIASDCGFNSKSVFNETFRKFAGKTPSAFRLESVT